MRIAITTGKRTSARSALAALAALGLLLGACGKGEAPAKDAAADGASGGAAASAPAAGGDKGVGPVSHLELGALDAALAQEGETLFSGTCAACHKMDARYVGPALGGVTKRRKPEWIMNMMLNPVEMTQKDPTAKALLGEYMTQMSVAVTQEDARALLEYFRKVDG